MEVADAGISRLGSLPPSSITLIEDLGTCVAVLRETCGGYLGFARNDPDGRQLAMSSLVGELKDVEDAEKQALAKEKKLCQVVGCPLTNTAELVQIFPVAPQDCRQLVNLGH